MVLSTLAKVFVVGSSLLSADAFTNIFRLSHASTSKFATQYGHSQNSLKMSVETTEVTMPALSSTMKEGKIVQWLKAEGDQVDMGDALMVVESDKADMDVESFEEGYLAKILVEEGDAAEVGSAVALIVKSADDVAAVQSGAAASSSSAGAPAPAPAASAPAAAPAASGGSSKPNVPFNEVAMPALSSTMKEGKIVQWLKTVGEKVDMGEALMVVESDKADMDVESFDEGYLAAVMVDEGGSVAVGEPCAYLVENEGDLAAVQAWVESGGPAASGGGGGGGSAPAPAPAPAAAQPAPAQTASVGGASDGHIEATGYAKKLAAEYGISLVGVVGTGPGGKISAGDVEAIKAGGGGGASAAAAAPAAAAVNKSPNGLTIATPTAKALAKSKGLKLEDIQGTGNFGRIVEDDVLKALGLPPKKAPPAPPAPAPAPAAAPAAGSSAAAPAPAPAPAKAASGGGGGGESAQSVLGGTVVPLDGMQKAVAANMEATLSVPIFRVSRAIGTDKFDALYQRLKPKGVTVSALLAKAVGNALEKHPLVNAAYDGKTSTIKYPAEINVAMAVAIDGGLITPVLRRANEVDLYQLSRDWKELVGKAKAKKLSPPEYNTGTFTISNLGMFGVSQFDAILPPGQGSILAIGASTPTVVQHGNGFFGVEKKMTVTITSDHRHIYGAHAAEFLKDLAEIIEKDPESLLF